MSTRSDRVLAFLSNWTEKSFAYSCEEIAAQLTLGTSDVQLALAGLENAGKVVSVDVDGMTYYASQLARVERALTSLVQKGEVEAEEGPDGQLRYHAKRPP